MSDAYLLLTINRNIVASAFVAGGTYNTITRVFDGRTAVVEALCYPGADFKEAMDSLYSSLIEGEHPELLKIEAVRDLIIREWGEKTQGHDYEPPEE